MFATVMAFPLVCLGFLLWMAHLEDSLPAAVRRSERRPDPPPILAIHAPAQGLVGPVPVDEPMHVDESPHLPAQRSAPPLLPDVVEPLLEAIADAADPGVDPSPAPGVA